MQRITQFDGLYGDAQAQTNGEYLFSELLETRSKTFNWIIEPHIHTKLFQLFFIESGSFQFLEATGRRLCEGPCLLLIPPASLHGFVYDRQVTGRILTISQLWLDNLCKHFPGASAMCDSIIFITSLQAPYTPDAIHNLIESIDEELFENRPEKKQMLEVCLQRLFLVLYRLWKESKEDSKSANHLSLQYYRKFTQCIRKSGTVLSVADMARQLGITTVHLNRVCQSIAHKSASQLINDYILDEARKYLMQTTHSVSEVAYILNFEYPNYFARFFKKQTGLTPKEFRSKIQNSAT